MCACAHFICRPPFLPADFKEEQAGRTQGFHNHVHYPSHVVSLSRRKTAVARTRLCRGKGRADGWNAGRARAIVRCASGNTQNVRYLTTVTLLRLGEFQPPDASC
jgi:hypothetical protein